MSMTSIRELQYDVLSAEREVSKIERVYGKDTPEYRHALTQLARIWSVLRLNRSREEFVHDLTKTHPN